MKKHTIKHYDTLEAALQESALDSCPSWDFKKRSGHKTSAHYSEFTGTSNHAEAVKLARFGWPEGLARMNRNVAAVASLPALSRAPSYTMDVAGAFPLAALAAAGDPACMFDFAPVSDRVRPIVRLYVNTTASHYYTESEIFNYGSGLVGIIDALESDGYRVELTTVTSAVAHNNDRCLFTVRIKDAQDSVDLDRMAFCLAHPSFFRRIMFGVMEQNLPESIWESNYGVPDLPDREKHLGGDVILLTGVQSLGHGKPELKTPEAAFKAMIPLINAALLDRFGDVAPLQFGKAA
jgi:hypothetical protein